MKSQNFIVISYSSAKTICNLLKANLELHKKYSEIKAEYSQIIFGLLDRTQLFLTYSSILFMLSSKCVYKTREKIVCVLSASNHESPATTFHVWLSVPLCFRKDKVTKTTSKRLKSDLLPVKSHSSSNWMASRRWRPKLVRIFCIIEEHSKANGLVTTHLWRKSRQINISRGRHGAVIRRRKKHKPVDWLTELLKLLR